MSDVARFNAYAEAFEKAYEAEDFELLEPFFEVDSVYEIVGEPPLGGVHEGRAAIFGHFRNSVDSFDRAFDTRALELLEGPDERDGGVFLRWRAHYTVAGAPDFTLEGEERVWFEGDRIVRLEDRYPDGSAATVVAYMGAHGAKLHPVNRGT